MRPLTAAVMDSLTVRQLAYCVSGCTGNLTAADVLECGGELVSCLQESHASPSLARTASCCENWMLAMALLQESLLVDHLAMARKKRDKSQETTAAMEDILLLSSATLYRDTIASIVVIVFRPKRVLRSTRRDSVPWSTSVPRLRHVLYMQL